MSDNVCLIVILLITHASILFAHAYLFIYPWENPSAQVDVYMNRQVFVHGYGAMDGVQHRVHHLQHATVVGHILSS